MFDIVHPSAPCNFFDTPVRMCILEVVLVVIIIFNACHKLSMNITHQSRELEKSDLSTNSLCWSLSIDMRLTNWSFCHLGDGGARESVDAWWICFCCWKGSCTWTPNKTSDLLNLREHPQKDRVNALSRYPDPYALFCYCRTDRSGGRHQLIVSGARQAG